MAKKKEDLFISAEEGIETLRELVQAAEEQPGDPQFLENIRNVLERVKAAKLGQASIDAAIINLLKRYEKNASGNGLTMPFIWRQLKSGGDPVTNLMVEKSLITLLDAGKIHKVINGITYYKLGAKPEDKPGGGSKE